jgi:hypothetical protein
VRNTDKIWLISSEKKVWSAMGYRAMAIITLMGPGDGLHEVIIEDNEIWDIEGFGYLILVLA